MHSINVIYEATIKNQWCISYAHTNVKIRQYTISHDQLKLVRRAQYKKSFAVYTQQSHNPDFKDLDPHCMRWEKIMN